MNLVGLNDRFLFIFGCTNSSFTGDKSRGAIFVLNRCDGNSLFRHIEAIYRVCFIYNNEVFLENPYLDDPFFLVFDSNSDSNDEPVTRVGNTKDGMFSYLYSTSNYKYIYSRRFDDDNFLVKFDLY